MIKKHPLLTIFVLILVLYFFGSWIDAPIGIAFGALAKVAAATFLAVVLARWLVKKFN